MAQKKAAETTAQKKTQAAKSRAGESERTKGSRLPRDPLAEEPQERGKAKSPGYGREIGAFVCLFLAVFCALGLFGVRAIFIDALCALVQGLMGLGFYLMIPELILCSFILFRHRGRPVAFRLCCALLTPLAFGSFMHLVLGPDITGAYIKTLWQTGRALRSGGVLAGGLAMLFRKIFSGIGAGILLFLLFALLLLASFRITVISITQAIQNRPRPEGKPEPEDRDPATVIVNHVANRHIQATEQRQMRRQSSIKDFDLPVDEPITPARGQSKAAQASAKANKKPRTDSQELQQKITQALQEPEPIETVTLDPERLGTKARAEAPAQASFEEQTATVAVPEFRPISTKAASEHGASMVELVGALAQELQTRPEPAQDRDTPPWEAPRTQAETLSAPEHEAVSPASTAPEQALTAPNAPLAREETSLEPEEVPQEDTEDTYDGEDPEKNPDPEAVPERESSTGELTIDGENLLVTGQPYKYPEISLLGEIPLSGPDGTQEMQENAARLADTLQSFNIDATITNVTRGPAVTRYELELDRGVKLSKLTNLSDDIALALGASGVRISAIPDRISVVGVEVPNKIIRTVYAREVMDSPEFKNHKSKVAFALGVNISGEKIVVDLSKMPHLLIAGTTGSGKSVCINTLIVSLLYRASPEEVRMIMVDPKMIELGGYNGIPHLLVPVVTDPKKAAGALQWAVQEMMRRYQLLADAGVKDLEAYNLVMERQGQEKLPKIVIVIDELADLMMVAAKEVEESICRIAQLARAAGMHLVIATQRPSSDVITGLMKANVPSHIAFAVSSQLESRIILDTSGAEKLVGKGDMLYAPIGGGKPQRVQGCFISGDEVEKVVEYIKSTGESDYSDDVMAQIDQQAAQSQSGSKGSSAAGGAGGASAAEDSAEDGDELLPAAVEVILETGQASVSMLQRRLKLGYARAARIVDEMEERGIVGPFEGSKPRQLLITKEQWAQMQGGNVGQYLQAQDMNGTD